MPGEASPQGAPLAPQNTTEQAQAAAHTRQLQPEKWMITDGPRDPQGKIRYHSQEGYLVGLAPGKIITTATHSLVHLRGQGIVLQRVPDEVLEEELPELPPAVAAPDPDKTSEGAAADA